MPLTAEDRAFLSQEWRWVEENEPAIKTRHPGAREAEYSSAFVTIGGASAAAAIMQAAVSDKPQAIVASVFGIVDVSFKGRPPTVRLYHDRFGGDPDNGRLLLCERAIKDHANDRTTFFLIG